MSVIVELSNLGPLRSVELELSDLTLFIGDNNTGKTFFATVLHRTLDARFPDGWYRPGRSDRPPDAVTDWILRAMDESGEEVRHPDSPAHNPSGPVLEWVRALTVDSLTDYGAKVRSSIEYAFGTHASDLRRRTQSRHAVDCYLKIRNQVPSWQVEIRFDSDLVTVEPPDPQDCLTDVFDLERWRDPSRIRLWRHYYSIGRRGNDTPLVWHELHQMLEASLFPDWPDPVVHLPSDRTGIMHSYHVLAGNVVQQSAAAGIRPIGIEPLPGTAADFVSLVLSPERRLHQPSLRKPIQSIIDRLETAMRAQIVTDRSTERSVESIVAMTPEGPFSLWRTSSMISELAPILLVLKHSMGDGGHLTIDEPESHLHPEMQRQVAACLATLVNHGYELLLTTHSDYIVNAISNMVRATELDGYSQRGVEGSLPRIDKAKISVLQFCRESRWCIAQPVDITPLDGIDDSTFTRVMESQYSETADLIDDLLEAEVYQDATVGGKEG